MSAFVLDANVFIQAARRYYGFDIVPGFWEALANHAECGQVQSVDRVKQEITRGNDQLAQWVQGPFNAAFATTDDPDVIRSFAEMMAWVQANSQFTAAAKAEFAEVADGWLVAYALVKDGVLVTHEQPNTNMRRKVPIPSVCHAFGVPYIDTFDMLRRLGVRFA